MADTLRPSPRMKTVGVDLAYWEYDRLVRAYAARFGRDNVKVIDFGAFSRYPEGALKEIADFIGLTSWTLSALDLATRLNTGESDRQTRVRRWLNQFTESELNRFPLVDLPNRVSAAVVRWCGRTGAGRPLFGDEFDRWVDERFAPANERLAAECGVELTRSLAPDGPASVPAARTPW